MAQLILPLRSTQQPQYPAPIDVSNSLARGLTGALHPFMRGAQKVGGAGFQATRNGIGFSTFATSDAWIVSQAALASASPTWTMLAILSGKVLTNGAAGVTFYAERPNDTQIAKLELNTSSGTVSLVVRDLSGNLANPAGTTDIRTDTGAPRVVVGTRRATNQHLVFLNGKQEGSNSTNVSGSFGATNGVVGADPQDSSGYLAGASLPLVLVWNRSLSDAEIAEISRNPWQIFKAPSRRMWVPSAVTGPTYTLPMNAGSFASSGASARLVASRRLAAAAGGYTLTTLAAALVAARRIVAVPGALSLAGTAANLKAARRLPAAAGAVALTGAAAKLTAARKLTVAPGAFALTGGTATFVYTSAPGGQGPTYTLTGGSGAFLLTASTARLLLARRLVAAAGAFSAAGSPIALVVKRRLAGAAGSLAIVAAPAGLRATRRLPAAAASFSLTGSTATFFYSPIDRPGEPTYTLTAVGGALGLTGTGIGMRARRRLSGGAGQLALTGSTAQLVYSQQIVYARAPAGSGYTPKTVAVQHRPASTPSVRPAALQRNTR